MRRMLRSIKSDHVTCTPILICRARRCESSYIQDLRCESSYIQDLRCESSYIRDLRCESSYIQDLRCESRGF